MYRHVINDDWCCLILSQTHSDEDHSVTSEVGAEKLQPVQSSLWDFRDDRLRQSLTTSIESKAAWSDLMSFTNVCDHAELIERLSKESKRTTCPSALALDLFYALHGDNKAALAALDQHDQQRQSGQSTSGGVRELAVSDIPEDHNQQHQVTLSACLIAHTSRCMKTTVKNKWKSMVRRLGLDKTTQGSHCGEEGNSKEVSNPAATEDQMVSPPLQDDIGIDNPAFQDTEVTTSDHLLPTDQVFIKSPSVDDDGNFIHEIMNGHIFQPVRTSSTMSNDSGYVGTCERSVKMPSITEYDA